MSFYDRFLNRTGRPPANLHAMYHVTEAGKEKIDRNPDWDTTGRVLMALAEEGSMTGIQVANSARVNNTVAQMALTKLERWGFIASTGNDYGVGATSGEYDRGDL